MVRKVKRKPIGKSAGRSVVRRTGSTIDRTRASRASKSLKKRPIPSGGSSRSPSAEIGQKGPKSRTPPPIKKGGRKGGRGEVVEREFDAKVVISAHPVKEDMLHVGIHKASPDGPSLTTLVASFLVKRRGFSPSESHLMCVYWESWEMFE